MINLYFCASYSATALCSSMTVSTLSALSEMSLSLVTGSRVIRVEAKAGLARRASLSETVSLVVREVQRSLTTSYR